MNAADRPRGPLGRRGATLVELVVALAVLAVLTAVAGLMLPRRSAAGTQEPSVLVARTRSRALASRRPAQLTLPDSTARGQLRVLPDGRVIADSALHLDPLTGRPDAAR